jgi:hypothetical protein
MLAASACPALMDLMSKRRQPPVAERARHSVHVLLQVYAKCIEGQDEAARRRIEQAFGDVGDQGDAA